MLFIPLHTEQMILHLLGGSATKHNVRVLDKSAANI